MKYIISDLKSVLHENKLILVLMIICVFSSAFILNFSYGLYRNYNQEKIETNADLLEMHVTIDGENDLYKKDFQSYVENLPQDVLDKIDFWFISGTLEEFQEDSYPWIDSRFAYHDGVYTIPEIVRVGKEKFLCSGRFISDEEESTGANVAVVANPEEQGWNTETLNIKCDENTIELFGKEYTVIGESKQGAVTPIVPFLSIPNDFIYDDTLVFTFTDTLDKQTYQTLQEYADEYIPNTVTFPELNLPDTDSIQIYNNIIIMACFISIVSILNFVLIWQYLLQRKKRKYAVMMLCGCKKSKLFLQKMTECLLIQILSFVLGSFAFHCILTHLLNKYFIYMEDFFSFQIYGLLFGIYTAIMVLFTSFLLFLYLKKNIVETWKEGV